MTTQQDCGLFDHTQRAHDFKVSKQQAGIYITCCGDEIKFYTSTEFGLSDSVGWYITQANGSFNGDRFHTLAEAKTFLIRYHTVKVGA
jgi:hypothetical protein